MKGINAKNFWQREEARERLKVPGIVHSHPPSMSLPTASTLRPWLARCSSRSPLARGVRNYATTEDTRRLHNQADWEQFRLQKARVRALSEFRPPLPFTCGWTYTLQSTSSASMAQHRPMNPHSDSLTACTNPRVRTRRPSLLCWPPERTLVTRPRG